MADTYECANGDFSSETAKGLQVHMTKVHGQKAEQPTQSKPTTAAGSVKEKMAVTLSKASVTKLANVPLKIAAISRGNPKLPFNAEESATVDACVQDLIAESDLSTLKSLEPYLPWINLILLAGPIILDKLIMLMPGASAADPPPANTPKPTPELADGSKPTLSRRDVMPDAGSSDE
jgi:hypothetical protein